MTKYFLHENLIVKYKILMTKKVKFLSFKLKKIKNTIVACSVQKLYSTEFKTKLTLNSLFWYKYLGNSTTFLCFLSIKNKYGSNYCTKVNKKN